MRTRVEEDDGLEAGELGVVELDVVQRLDELVEHAVDQLRDAVGGEARHLGGHSAGPLSVLVAVVARHDQVGAEQ